MPWGLNALGKKSTGTVIHLSLIFGSSFGDKVRLYNFNKVIVATFKKIILMSLNKVSNSPWIGAKEIILWTKSWEKWFLYCTSNYCGKDTASKSRTLKHFIRTLFCRIDRLSKHFVFDDLKKILSKLKSINLGTFEYQTRI